MVMTSRARIRDQRFGFDLGLSTAENIEYVQSLREKYLDSKELDSLDVKETLPNGEWCNRLVYCDELFSAVAAQYLFRENLLANLV